MLLLKAAHTEVSSSAFTAIVFAVPMFASQPMTAFTTNTTLVKSQLKTILFALEKLHATNTLTASSQSLKNKTPEAVANTTCSTVSQ